MSLMASFCAVFFQLYVFDEIWELIKSVSEGFPADSFIKYTNPIAIFSVFSKCHRFVRTLAIFPDYKTIVLKYSGN